MLACSPFSRLAFIRQSALNILTLVLLSVAAVMLGKSCWIHVKAQVAQVLLERSFERSLANGKPEKPWTWADMWPVARLSIRRLAASEIVLDGTSGEALAFGPGTLHEMSDFGEPGTTVVAAHRDTHFRFLQYVVAGDIIDVERNDGLKFKYKVTGMRIADWNQSGIARDKNGFNLVLATCYPFDAITHGSKRYLVEAKMIQ
jgi:sortase A